MKKMLLIILSLFALPVSLSAELGIAKLDSPDGYDKGAVIGFPFHRKARYEINLIFKIPPGYLPVFPNELWKSIPLIEFIPKNETVDNYTSILTIHPLLGSRVSAPIFLKKIERDFFKPSLKNVRLLKTTAFQGDGYQEAVLFVSYDHEDKHEVIGLRYFSNATDCIGFQCTIRPPQSQSDEESLKEVDSLLDKQVEFMLIPLDKHGRISKHK